MGILLRPLGHDYWGAEQTKHGITLFGKTERRLSFSEMDGPPQAEKSLGVTSVAFPLKDNSVIKVAGLKLNEATHFASVATLAVSQFITHKFNEASQELQTLLEVVERLQRPRRYPAACLLHPFHTRATEILNLFPKNLPDGVLTQDQQILLDTLSAFKTKPERYRNEAIKTFVASEHRVMKEFFEKIERNPLTREQRTAVITDEDATLVLAGAGSGKTSVIVAKAAYLIERRIRSSEEILLLAFGNGAATEIATRIQERTGASVDTMTFHALGNRIIRKVEGAAPALVTHASDDAQFRKLLRDILINDVATQPKLEAVILHWFSEFHLPYKSEWDFKTKHEYYQYVEAYELRTLNGELVRSYEELIIANWLYLNGIDYEYEPDYEYALPKNDRRTYTPDFRLTQSGVYIEHFGVRKSRGPDGKCHLTTAAHVNTKTYLASMDWKREVHREHGTVLIETYSYERVEGRLTLSLREKTSPYVMLDPLPPKQVFNILSEMGQIDAFTQTLGTFLRHFKSSGTSIKQCQSRIKNSPDGPRSRAFLEIFEPLFEAYQNRLGKRIDFEDMIIRATGHVKSGRFQSPYLHLLVDEFQDISKGRARLLQALKEQHPDARIFAVGDDWQSIYRFTGSDIHIMRNFGKEFGGIFADAQEVHSSVDLGRTFRCVDKVAYPARRFILRNPSQIEKTVIPASSTDTPVINVAYYNKYDDEVTLNNTLQKISRKTIGNTSVLLLGRYRHLQPKNLTELATRHTNLSLRFMTVHGSKGLEADHVVILNASNGRYGFPSEIVDDPLLDLVLPESEKFDHAEERRLFYVALTRARNSVTILADREQPSPFARELVEHPEYEAIQNGDLMTFINRCSECGGHMLTYTSKAKRMFFACEHRYLCGQTLPPCSSCGKNIPVKSPTNPNMMVCNCGATFSACTECFNGWLVERIGRYGRFLGCVRYPDCNHTQKVTKPKGARLL